MAPHLMNALDRALSWFEEWTLCIAVWLALIGLFANVVLRYGFNYTLAWSEELVREVIIYTTFIGCSAAVRSGSLIKVEKKHYSVPTSLIGTFDLAEAATSSQNESSPSPTSEATDTTADSTTDTTADSATGESGESDADSKLLSYLYDFFRSCNQHIGKGSRGFNVDVPEMKLKA